MFTAGKKERTRGKERENGGHCILGGKGDKKRTAWALAGTIRRRHLRVSRFWTSKLFVVRERNVISGIRTFTRKRKRRQGGANSEKRNSKTHDSA